MVNQLEAQMAARNNFSPEMIEQIVIHSCMNPVAETAERFGISEQMVIRYRKRLRVTSRLNRSGKRYVPEFRNGD